MIAAVLALAGWHALGGDLPGAPVPTPAANGSGVELLATASTVAPQPARAPRGAVLIGADAGVRLLRSGFVQSFSVGTDTRAAPAGQRLLAFTVQPLSGESGADAAITPRLAVRVNGVEHGPLVITSDYLVTAVPVGNPTVELVLDDGGLKQGLSLLTGRPAATNPSITSRANRQAVVGITKKINVRVAGVNGAVGVTSGTITLSSVALTYWGQDGTRAGTPTDAFLHVMARVTLSGDRTGYGAESGLVTVALPGSAPRQARNCAVDPATGVDDVVEVPAGTTAGTMTYSGTLHSVKGTITVLTPVTIAFHIIAG